MPSMYSTVTAITITTDQDNGVVAEYNKAVTRATEDGTTPPASKEAFFASVVTAILDRFSRSANLVAAYDAASPSVAAAVNALLGL